MYTAPLAIFALSLGILGCSAKTETPASADRSAGSASPPDSRSEIRHAPAASGSTISKSFAESRAKHTTRLIAKPDPEAAKPDVPPKSSPFELIAYNSNVGKLHAYITHDPGDGKQHPAIVWITGGDCNSIGDVWRAAAAANDQTAAQYRSHGIRARKNIFMAKSMT
jgi:hypothetical protein